MSIACGLPSYQVNAGIPTIDVANIIQTTISSVENVQQVVQLYQQIDNQIQQIKNQYDAINNQVKQFENLNGDYFKDMLLNNASYKSKRRLVPKTFQEVLDLYKNIGVAGHEIATDAGWDAKDNSGLEDANVYFDDLATKDAQIWQQNQNNAMAAVGVADSSFQRVEELIKESEDLMDDIKNSTDAKAAQDLANRMAAQNQLILAELLRIQSAQLATTGRDQLARQAINGRAIQMATFTEIPSILTTP